LPRAQHGHAECRHRAAVRLAERLEAETARPAASRADIIAGIKSAWSRRFPTDFLADELIRRFRRNQLEMLSVDFLAAIRAAIAETGDFPMTTTTTSTAPFRQTHASSVSSVSSQQRQTQTQTHASFNSEGLRLLRESLRDIAFSLQNLSFKVDVRGNAVWIRMMEAVSGTQQMTHSAKAKLEILDDAVTMPRDAYRARLERFLRGNGFTI
jgi:hypothetical protein